MTDELIGKLSKISALRVISRTSAMRYKGAQKSLPEIARELQVDAVVEGSVLRSGDRVRINARLIDVAADRQVWAESYERDLRDVLALQSDVASAIVREIRVKVAPEESSRLVSQGPVDPEAYQLYLQGRVAFSRFTPESLAAPPSTSTWRSPGTRSTRSPTPAWPTATSSSPAAPARRAR